MNRETAALLDYDWENDYCRIDLYNESCRDRIQWVVESLASNFRCIVELKVPQPKRITKRLKL